jgi:hypothetical protein
MAPDLENNSAIKHVAAQDFIPLFTGRPKREKVIGKDDLLDLDILLHTCDTVEAFLAKA